MNESTYIIPMETALDKPERLFVEAELSKLLARIRTATSSVVADVSTAEGRATLKSLAYKIARSKTAIDDAGKALVADLKAQSGKIDALRKHARDDLDSLKDEVRAPLTAWEEEQARIEREELERIEAARREREAAQLAELEQLRREKEERDAADQAKAQAEAQAARDEAIRERALAEARAAALAEAAREKAEHERLIADVEYRKRINNEARDGLMKLGIAEETAKAIVVAIATKKIPNLFIKY